MHVSNYLLSIYLSTIYLLIYLLICYLFIYLSIYLLIYHLLIYLLIYYLSTYLLFIYLSIYWTTIYLLPCKCCYPLLVTYFDVHIRYWLWLPVWSVMTFSPLAVLVSKPTMSCTITRPWSREIFEVWSSILLDFSISDCCLIITWFLAHFWCLYRHLYDLQELFQKLMSWAQWITKFQTAPVTSILNWFSQTIYHFKAENHVITM